MEKENIIECLSVCILILCLILSVGSLYLLNEYQKSAELNKYKLDLLNDIENKIDVLINNNYCKEYSDLNKVELKVFEGEEYVLIDDNYINMKNVKRGCTNE